MTDDQHTVTESLYAVKPGRMHDEQRAAISAVTARMVSSGADVIISACTDTPLALTEESSLRPLIVPPPCWQTEWSSGNPGRRRGQPRSYYEPK